jgi:hypothetical protein
MRDGGSWMLIASNGHSSMKFFDFCSVFYVPISDLPMLSRSLSFSSKSSCSIFSSKLYIT